MPKKGSLLSTIGQLIAQGISVKMHRDIDNSLIGQLNLQSTQGLSNGNYRLQLSTGEWGTIIVHRVRPKRLTFVVFGEFKL